MVPQAFRSPVQSLSDFLRSLAVPRVYYGTTSTPDAEAYEWAALRAQQRGATRIDFHDHGLRGPAGAITVLRAIEQSPAVTALTLSHNPLGDDGLRELLVGIKRVRARDIGSHLEELNLSGCGLTDVSLHLLALHLLSPSPHPPSLRALSLNNNQISLGAKSTLSSLPEFLAATLSAPESSLRSLTISNNPHIDSSAFVELLSRLDLSTGPSQLAELRMSVTRLSPEVVEPLVKWLESPTGGSRLQVLALNSCGLGRIGVQHIQHAVVNGRIRNLLHLELMANEEITDGEHTDTIWSHVVDPLRSSAETSGEDFHDWDVRLKAALDRNRLAWLATRRAALALLGPARICFGGNAQEAIADETNEATGWPVAASFPFLRLPVEVQVHVLRCLLFLLSSPSTDPVPSSSTPSSTVDAALTEPQFLRILGHSSSRRTLAIERQIALAQGLAPSLNGTSGVGTKQQTTADERDPASGWEAWYLRATGCDRFE